MKTNAIIFTDLDGTLLDHFTYSFKAAEPALHYLKDHQIPVIIVTSKTRSEVENLLRELQFNYPFIVENGSAIIYPSQKNNQQPDVEILGKSVKELIPVYERLKAEFPVKGFTDMSVDEISQLTGLSAEEAKHAGNREFSIPFLIQNDERGSILSRLEKICDQYDCAILQGGRFFHLIGKTSKGKAIKHLKDKFVAEGLLSPDHISFGLGDAPNDTEIFIEVDIPVMVEKPGGGYRELRTEIPRLIYARGEGPLGWFWAFEKIIKPRIENKEA